MTDRPIIYSGPMVRALLYGRKTQTRRVAKFVYAEPNGSLHLRNSGGGIFGVTADQIPIYGPNYAPFAIGDRLWVREALDMGFSGGFPICTCTYVADGAPVDLRPAPFWAGGQERNRISSIHMPKWASRLTLIVSGVKVQRLQDISEADAMAEGATPILVYPDGGSKPHCEGFRNLWNSINGPGAWDENPWVCAVTFTVHPVNIDMIEAGEVKP